METAFQADTFQNDAFQIASAAPPTPTGGRGGHYRHVFIPPQQIEVQVDDEDWIITIL